MISLINHDSRVWKNSEVVIIYCTQMFDYQMLFPISPDGLPYSLFFGHRVHIPPSLWESLPKSAFKSENKMQKMGRKQQNR